jgi:DnaJ-class molecular chaperone
VERDECFPWLCHGNLQVITPESIKALVGKGMPIKGNSFVKGDLFIKFDVKFPTKDQLNAEALAVCGCSGAIGATSRGG